jgi:hypothetical protein
MHINGRLAKLAGALTPPPAPPGPEGGRPGLRIDEGALNEAVRLMKAAGFVFEEDETPAEDEKPRNHEEGQP